MRKQLRQRFGLVPNTPIRWVVVDGPDGEQLLAEVTLGKATKWTPGPKRGKNWCFFPRSRGGRAMLQGQRGQSLQPRTEQASVSHTIPIRH